MSIKIGNHAEAAAPTQAVGSTTQKQGATAKPAEQATPAVGAAAPEASTTVSLSSAASSLTSTGSANADFDAEKVKRISDAIENGSFKVNPEAIADKLIANAREVLGH
jgi:negative regulator of flagellin synthesis FlgM